MRDINWRSGVIFNTTAVGSDVATAAITAAVSDVASVDVLIVDVANAGFPYRGRHIAASLYVCV